MKDLFCMITTHYRNCIEKQTGLNRPADIYASWSLISLLIIDISLKMSIATVIVASISLTGPA